jgi:hypothetical protein
MNTFVVRLLILLCFVLSVCRAQSDPHDLAQEYIGFSTLQEAGVESANSPNSKSVSSGKKSWNYYDKTIGTPLRTWALEHIAPSPGGTVFYPFSGPDFVTVSQIFPKADRFILAAIQPAGPPVDTKTMPEAEVQAFKSKFLSEWVKFGQLGFFRTIDLNENTGSATARLTSTPVLMAFAAALGYRVQSVIPLELNKVNGEYEPQEISLATKWNSVRLRLSRDARDVVLDYICIDLSDVGLKSKSPERAWIEMTAQNPVLLKAASHLLPDPYFTACRAAIVNGAPLLIQDETGLDYADLKKIGDVKLYGRFAGVHKLFKQQQPELVAAYAEAGQNTLPLPFAYSYQKSAERRSMQVVRRSP